MQALWDFYEYKQNISDTVYVPNNVSYYSEIFDCEYMKLTTPVEFFNCRFPNLRVLEIADSMKMPFNECSFDHAVNLKIDKIITWNLPETFKIRSIKNTVAAEISCREDSYLLITPGRTICEFNTTLQVQYGDSPDRALKLYRREFALPKVYYDVDVPHEILESMQLQVTDGKEILGTVCFALCTNKFIEAIFATEGEDIVYAGNIPANWSTQLNKRILKEMRKFSTLTIEGDIGDRAFAEMYFDLNALTLNGELGENVFWMADGQISLLKVKHVHANTFSGCDIELHTVELGQVETEVQLDADVVSVAKSTDVQAIMYTKTLVIRDIFEEPLDLGHLDATIVDFRSVITPGPFVLKNFAQKAELEYGQPELVCETTYGKMSGFCMQDIEDEILEEIKTSYSGDQFKFDIQGDKITVKMKYDDEVITVGHWKIQLYSWLPTLIVLGMVATAYIVF